MPAYTDTLRAKMVSGYSSGTPDEYTGDPRIRDLWEKTRAERHTLIRSMHGDMWAESTAPARLGIVLSNGFFWIIGVPFLWAACCFVTLVSGAIVMALAGCEKPVEAYLGTGGSGGLGDWLVFGSLGLAVLLASFAVWGRTAGIDREIRRLRGLSNTDLLAAHDRWREEKALAAERARRENDRFERRMEADYLARRIGEETRQAAYGAGIQLEHFHDVSERIAGRRP